MGQVSPMLQSRLQNRLVGSPVTSLQATVALPPGGESGQSHSSMQSLREHTLPV